MDLTVATNGVISGIPVNDGTNFFIVRTTDSFDATMNELLSLIVNAATNNQTVSITAAKVVAGG